MWIHGLRSGPPASSSRTRYFPDSLRRAATGQPAEPAPVTMKSKVSAFVTIRLGADCGCRTIVEPGGSGKAAGERVRRIPGREEKSAGGAVGGGDSRGYTSGQSRLVADPHWTELGWKLCSAR